MGKMFSLQKEILILKPASFLFGEEHVIKESATLTAETKIILKPQKKNNLEFLNQSKLFSQSKCGNLCKSLKIVFWVHIKQGNNIQNNLKHLHYLSPSAILSQQTFCPCPIDFVGVYSSSQIRLNIGSCHLWPDRKTEFVTLNTQVFCKCVTAAVCDSSIGPDTYMNLLKP